MSLVVGLTGGIGSGKSTVAHEFELLGAAIVDTDAIAHELTAADGAAIDPIRAAFGPTVLTSEWALDRAALRRHVFAAPAARLRLEAILHPLIRAASERQIRHAISADFPYVILVVPLLVESGDYRTRVDRVVVVDCPAETQIARTMARSALSREEVLAIMAAQSQRQERLAAADDVIDNDAGLDSLRRQIALLDAQYRRLAGDEAKSEERQPM
jgi:dephospho-CoA kinase